MHTIRHTRTHTATFVTGLTLGKNAHANPCTDTHAHAQTQIKPHVVWRTVCMLRTRWNVHTQRACMRSWDPHHLNSHLNADVELRLLPHTDNTFGWLFQLGLSSAPLLICTDSSFQRVHRDKAASSFLYYTHLKPLDCEKSFNAVPLRGEKNSLKKKRCIW